MPNSARVTETVPCYGRWQGTFEGSEAVEAIQFTGPEGRNCRRPVFLHQPAVITYDDHGYETITLAGDPVLAARVTPDLAGEWRYAWLSGERAVQEGDFVCEPSDHPGFVEVSRHDPRYFAHTNGAPYVAVGLNLCRPPMYPLTTGQEFQTGSGRGTLGAREYERWFRSLADNGGNFARLWLGLDYFQVELEAAGNMDPLRLAALDRVVELAREYGIRLKLCLEYFRHVGPGDWQAWLLRHPDDGRQPADMDEWFESPDWQGLWWGKVEALVARYGDDPTVMAWELWNEINCCATSAFSVQTEWTRRVLPVLKAATPRNLVVNSLGSFDTERMQAQYDDFKMEEMEFNQVHRYLDQGAPWAMCHTDPVVFSRDAIQRTRRPDRPVLLAETGAVNDRHSGPFRYYRADHEGLIFHDTTYPAFFAGAAGSGHMWHWYEYVDQKNLWGGFRALGDLIEGVAVDREQFVPSDLSGDDYWCLLLVGRTCTLGWLRNRADRWDHVLRDGKLPPTLSGVALDLAPLGITASRVEVFRPWPGDGAGAATHSGGVVRFPDFRHGLVFRIQHSPSGTR
jgi:hypothetical protein